MASIRQTHRGRSISLVLAVVFGLLLFVSSASASAGTKHAKSADTDLICHTSDPDDCYPRIFQPTDEFQTVRDDQQLPSGLHVRLNIWTGQKEAKINVPGDDGPSLEGLPVDSGMVVVEPEQPEEPQIPKGAPEYENVGKIKEPEQDAHSFHEAFKLVKTGAVEGEKAFDEALASMEDISHDIYYGLKITEDPEFVKGLLCLFVNKHTQATDGMVPRDHQAAAILAGALQNNPTALKEVEKAWPSLMQSQCPSDNVLLRQRLYSRLDTFKDPQGVAKVKAKVSAFNGLIKSDDIRAEFLKHDGMRLLLEALVPEDKEWAGVQRKVGQLVLDNFLDENMGAKLGQWPKAPRLSDKQCQSAESRTQDGCWDYHAERIMKANKKDKSHWSRQLHDGLAAARTADGGEPIHVEL